MKDAFKNKLQLNDKVIYSVKGGGGTEYVVGKIVKLLPHKESKAQFKFDPIMLKVTTISEKYFVCFGCYLLGLYGLHILHLAGGLL